MSAHKTTDEHVTDSGVAEGDADARASARPPGGLWDTLATTTGTLIWRYLCEESHWAGLSQRR